MKKLITILTASLAAIAVSFGNEPATSFNFSPSGHYDIGSSADSPAGIYINGLVYRHTRVALTAANLIAMYTSPVVLVPAQGAGKSIIVHKLIFTITRTSTAFTGGGAVIVQYDS